MSRLQNKVAEDVQLLRSVGPDREVVGRICEAMTELAKAKVARSPKFSAFRDEMYAYAMEEIYYGTVKAATELKDDNIVFYLAGRLNRNIPKIVFRLMHPGHSWDSAHAKDGRKNWAVEFEEYQDEHGLIFTEPVDNLFETIMSLCDSQFEENVILSLRERNTYQETADKLGCSIAWVQQVRHKIHERFKAYVRAETADAVRGKDSLGLGPDGAHVVGQRLHASSRPTNSVDALLAEYGS